MRNHSSHMHCNGFMIIWQTNVAFSRLASLFNLWSDAFMMITDTLHWATAVLLSFAVMKTHTRFVGLKNASLTNSDTGAQKVLFSTQRNVRAVWIEQSEAWVDCTVVLHFLFTSLLEAGSVLTAPECLVIGFFESCCIFGSIGHFCSQALATHEHTSFDYKFRQLQFWLSLIDLCVGAMRYVYRYVYGFDIVSFHLEPKRLQRLWTKKATDVRCPWECSALRRVFEMNPSRESKERRLA